MKADQGKNHTAGAWVQTQPLAPLGYMVHYTSLSLHPPFDRLTQTSNIHAQHSLRGTETDIHGECLRQGSSSPMAICEGSHRTREQHRRYAVEGRSKPFDRKIEARLRPCQVILEASESKYTDVAV